MFSTSPAFNLKVVLKETGVAADTLRAWERRYGLPRPQRTEGGHRLYSQRDIEIIKWLLKEQESGLSISRAVDRFNELLGSGTDPLAGARGTSDIALLPLPSDSASLVRLRDEWLKACLSYNEALAELIFNHAFALHPVETVITQIIQRGLHEIGELWYSGNVTVQQEHFSSGLAMRRLEALIAASPPPTRSETVLLACPPNEWHTLSLMMVHLFLRRRGFHAVYLGANVPISRFEETARHVKASLVVLVSHTLIGAASLQKSAAALTRKKMTVGYGGRIFNLQPEITRRIPGYYLGSDVNTSVNEIEKILGGVTQKPRHAPPSPEYNIAYDFFTSKRTDIEQTMRTVANLPKAQDDEFQTSLHFLGDNITAALQLGDMQYASAEMNWITLFLQSHKRPAGELAGFINAYGKAVSKHMNGSGKPVLTWLKDEAQRLKTA